MKRMLAIVLCVSLGTSACASAGGPRYVTAPAPAASQSGSPVVDPAVMSEFVQRIPAGSRVKVERAKGDTIRGTILKTTPDALVVQRNTRVPETPVEVPYSTIARVTLEDGTWGLVRASSNKPSLVVVVESPASEANMRAIFKDIDTRLSKYPEVGEYDQKI